jgi:hypothetical protein
MTFDTGSDKSDLCRLSPGMFLAFVFAGTDWSFTNRSGLIVECGLMHSATPRTNMPFRKPKKRQLKIEIYLVGPPSLARIAEIRRLNKVFNFKPFGQTNFIFDAKFTMSGVSFIERPCIQSTVN